jgi:hypothetical protein
LCFEPTRDKTPYRPEDQRYSIVSSIWADSWSPQARSWLGRPCLVIRMSNGPLYSQPTTPFSVTQIRLKNA